MRESAHTDGATMPNKPKYRFSKAHPFALPSRGPIRFGRRSGSKWIRIEKRAAIYHRDRWQCIYCKARFDQGAELSLDHIIPWSYGGPDSEDNLITACKDCNSARGNKSVLDFAPHRISEIQAQITKPIDAARNLARDKFKRKPRLWVYGYMCSLIHRSRKAA